MAAAYDVPTISIQTPLNGYVVDREMESIKHLFVDEWEDPMGYDTRHVRAAPTCTHLRRTCHAHAPPLLARPQWPPRHGQSRQRLH